ncbi:hypothetical protein ACFXDJ_30670 [Streptomyces sp. NPDC059443]|uniref:WXG100-like domain-containing protein n=1 Tax=unclassified Streptomyces TaxID=2593676 RepID=UPI0036D043F6
MAGFRRVEGDAEDEAKDLLLTLGLWWPDANSGTLRHAADAWRTFADAVDDVRTPVNNAASSLITNNSGEAIEAFGTFWGRYAKGNEAGWLSDLAKSSRQMAEALDKFAGAVDDAINKLWTQIGIDAAIIVGGIALAFVTAGAAAGAAALATEALIEFGATMGVAITTAVAEIAAGTLVAAVFGSIESVTIDLAVAQPLKIATGMQKGFSLDEVNAAAEDGMIYGGAFGAAGGVAKAGIEGSLFTKADGVPLMLRPPTLRPDLVELGPAARQCKSAASDGMRLVYPVPQPGEPVLPVKGARWPLEWDGKPDGVMTITDPVSGVVRTFNTPSLPAPSVSSTSPWTAGTTTTAPASTSSARTTASPPRSATPAATTSPSTPRGRASPPCACWTRPRRGTSRRWARTPVRS